MSSATQQDDTSVGSFFNVAETETLALFEHLSFEFFEEFNVFTPAQTGQTRGQFLSLCFSLVAAITNYEHRDNPESTVITV